MKKYLLLCVILPIKQNKKNAKIYSLSTLDLTIHVRIHGEILVFCFEMQGCNLSGHFRMSTRIYGNCKKKKKKIDQEFEKTFNHRYGRCLIH